VCCRANLVSPATRLANAQEEHFRRAQSTYVSDVRREHNVALLSSPLNLLCFWDLALLGKPEGLGAFHLAVFVPRSRTALPDCDGARGQD